MRRLAALAAVAALSTGCQLSQLQFRGDHRLTFTGPPARHRVVAPFTVTWTMRGFSATGLDGSHDATHGLFAVFVDRAPMRVGQGIRALAGGDTSCLRNPRCPDAAYLASINVYLTSDTSLPIPVLPAQSSGIGDEQHSVTIVLLDGTGRRIGESSWYLPFTAKRRTA